MDWTAKHEVDVALTFKFNIDLIWEAEINFLSDSLVNNWNFTADKRIFETQKPVPICIMDPAVGFLLCCSIFIFIRVLFKIFQLYHLKKNAIIKYKKEINSA